MYADWYAVELDGYLRGRMSEVQRFEATREILNHFAEHVDDLVSKGMDPIEAEKAAIVAFGSPRQAAINLLGQSKG
ncbi:MAG: permease prefix domain 1-containing protein, partial [Armatimonadota bacterium]